MSGRNIAGLLAVLLLAPVVPVEGQTARVVLDALPDSRVAANQDFAEREILNRSARDDNRITVVWDGEAYRWATRENRELIYRGGGLFGAHHAFVDPEGGGWIKVTDQRDFPELLRLDDGPNIQFYESASTGLTVLTYWGSASEFDP
ncbi:MAG: hypothetical protein OYL41_04485 [Acidobacteriota bacterium]|nr:hypothetical protein [Acidobacteriota bacterium]